MPSSRQSHEYLHEEAASSRLSSRNSLFSLEKHFFSIPMDSIELFIFVPLGMTIIHETLVPHCNDETDWNIIHSEQ